MPSATEPAQAASPQPQPLPRPVALEAYLARLPKVELHAHLSGCISRAKLQEMLRRASGQSAEASLEGAAGGEGGEPPPKRAKQCCSFEHFDCRALPKGEVVRKCFAYFDSVAKVVTDLSLLREAAIDVFHGFARERCIYCEMRTTPKRFRKGDGTATTDAEYLDALQEAIATFQRSAQDAYGYVMEVKILLSLNRGTVTDRPSALAQLDAVLALRHQHRSLVVGLDVCGNPAAPSVVPFVIPALLERRRELEGLPITFHTGEVPNSDEECELIVRHAADLNIRRLGHVCFLPEGLRLKILAGQANPITGIELCPTSNQCLMEIDTLKDHHFAHWWRKSDSVFVSINTDDAGLFGCSLTSELRGLAAAFDLGEEDLRQLQENSILTSFHPEKERLLQAFRTMLH